MNEHYAVNLDDNGRAYSSELRLRIAPEAFLYAVHVNQEIEAACSHSHFHPCAQESRFIFLYERLLSISLCKRNCSINRSNEVTVTFSLWV